MRAYNKRLNHITDIKSLDFITKKAKLLQPNSNPKFYYEENLDNIEVLEHTGVKIDGQEIYAGDEVMSTKGDIFKVTKIPGGYLPFCTPVRANFKKVD